MKVRFLRAYDYVPSGAPRVTIAYRADMELTVKRECGEAAVACGAAVEVEEVTAPVEPSPPAKPKRSRRA